MTVATLHMGLLKGQDGDNSRQYLNTSLAGSLDTIDAHDHSQVSGGKGMPVNMIPNGLLQFTSANERIRNPVNSATNLSVESADGYAFFSSNSGSHLAGNLYWDGTNWNLFNTGAAGAAWISSPSGIAYDTATAGTNPRTLSQKLTIDLSGNVSGRYYTSNDGSNGVINAGAGSLYLRSSGGANGIIMDTGTGGLNVAAGPIVCASYIAAGTAASASAGDLNAARSASVGYTWLGSNAQHYVGFDGTNYGMVNAGAWIGGTLHLDANGVNPNSPGAFLTFPQATGPKICLYDNGGGSFYGLGINGAEMYSSFTGTYSLRATNGAGQQVVTVSSTDGTLSIPGGSGHSPAAETGGSINLVNSGAVIAWRNAANNGDIFIGTDSSNHLILSGWALAANCSAGTGGFLPGTSSQTAGFITALINGATVKIPYFAN